MAVKAHTRGSKYQKPEKNCPVKTDFTQDDQSAQVIPEHFFLMIMPGYNFEPAD